MARFTEVEQIRPPATASYNFGSLANRLESFAAQQTAVHANKVANRSLAEGQAAFKEGEAPQFKEEKFFGNIASTNYNKGLRAAYVASVDRDNREEIAKIVAENPDDLSVFNDTVESYRTSLLNNVDPTARQVVADSLDSLISANRIKVQTNEIQRVHNENKQIVSEQIDAALNDALSFARDGNDQSAAESALAAFASVDASVDAGFISAAQAKDQKRNIEKAMVEEKLKGGVFRSLDEEGLQAAYGQLNDMAENRGKGFTPEEWDGFIAETQTELNRRASRLEKEAAANEARLKKEQDFRAIELRLEGDETQIINPKLADAYYQERIMPAIERFPPEMRQTAQANYIKQLKIVPDTMVAQITNAANSNNPDLLMEAASLVDRIDEIPGVINKTPKSQQAYLDTVVGLMQNMSPAEAVELARKATDPKDKARIEAVDVKIKDLKKDDPNIYLDRSRKAFRGFIPFGGPEADEVSKHKMAKEYQDIFESFMRAGSSEVDAFKKADKYIDRLWGVSSALGKKHIMKYPPEDYYSIDGDATWIKKELMADLQDKVANKIDDVFLKANDITARTASAGRPAYAVTVLIDGAFYPAGNWAPDMDAEVERRKQEKVSDALKRREANINGIDVDNILRGTRGL